MLALLAWLVATIPGHALTCPPGQIEEAGRCIPVFHHGYEGKSPPTFRPDTVPPAVETIGPDSGTKAGSGARARIRTPPPPPPPLPSSPPPPPPPAAGIQKGVVPTAGEREMRDAQPDRQLVPVRAYLRSSEIPPPSIGAYGVVAFRARPTSASRERLLMACTAFVASIPPQKSVPGSVRISDEMLTIWPLDQPSSPEAAKDDCNFAVDHYDLYGGDSAIADAERQGARLGADGPFLIGWSPSNSRGVQDKLVLVVDMSLYDSQDSFDQAFRFWKQKIVENPSLWRSGFSIEALRLAVRDFADNYGDTILKAAVSVWKNKPE